MQVNHAFKTKWKPNRYEAQTRYEKSMLVERVRENVCMYPYECVALKEEVNIIKPQKINIITWLMAHRSKQLNLIQERAKSGPCVRVNISVYFFFLCCKKNVLLFPNNNKKIFRVDAYFAVHKKDEKKCYRPKAKIIQSIFVLLFIGHLARSWTIFLNGPNKMECIIKLNYLTTRRKCEKNNIESK